MRPPWIYQFGAFLLLSAAGVAIVIDTRYSYRWVSQNISLDGEVAIGFCFVLAVLASSFGALITNPTSWQIMFAHTIKVSQIDDDYQRLLGYAGYALTGMFLFIFLLAVYSVNIISNTAETGHWFTASMICFASDAALMLVNPIWFMAKSSKMRMKEIDSSIHKSPRRRAQVVDD